MGISEEIMKKVFLLFALAALPTYFLSVLWWHIPVWLYIIVVIGAVCQLAGWIQLILLVKKHVAVIRLKAILVFQDIIYFFRHSARYKAIVADCIRNTCH